MNLLAADSYVRMNNTNNTLNSMTIDVEDMQMLYDIQLKQTHSIMTLLAWWLVSTDEQY